MGWARLDDGYATHPKLVAAGLEATGLDARAISHCARHETDGFVGDQEIIALAGDARKGKKLAAVLEAVHRWHRSGARCECLSSEALADTRPGYWVHDFLVYNTSKAALKEKRERDRVRKESERNPSGIHVESVGNPSGIRKESTRTSRARAPARAPRPSKDPPKAPPGGRKTTVPDDFEVTDEMRAWAKEKTPSLNGSLAVHTEAFLDHARANNKRFTDWPAAWRTWMRNAVTFGKTAGQRPEPAREFFE